MKKTIVWILLALALLFGAAAEDSAILGRPFPDFSVTDSQGNPFSLSEALQGHEAVLINLWASWCPPCEAEFPHLTEAYREYGDRVAFIALSCDGEDTPALIEAYRQAHGIPFPMAQDRDLAVDGYVQSPFIPVTVIVDRFGRAAFLQARMFASAGEIARTLDAFLGEGYTETAVLTRIPPDTSTRAYRVSAAWGIQVENGEKKGAAFSAMGDPEPQPAYVVYGDTAHLRVEVPADAGLEGVLLIDYSHNKILELNSLLDPESGAFVYDLPMPGPEEAVYACVSVETMEDQFFCGLYLIPGEEGMEPPADEMTARGNEGSREYPEDARTEDAGRNACYLLHVMDQEGAPVPQVYVNFCTDTACFMQVSDENGVIAFDGQPDVYHLQILRTPDGYSFDEGFSLYTDSAYGEWALRVKKD